VHLKDFTSRGEHQLEDLLVPLSTLLVPVFFVIMGMQVDLSAFGRTDVLLLAACLTVAAIVGKQACALGIVGQGGQTKRRLDRWSIGIGMIPRGEVGLIFAGVGMTLTLGGRPLIDSAMFSAIVIVVIVTTVVTPPALKWSLGRGTRMVRDRTIAA
jgi:Kef-type K+ transport system membrane component KefB